MTKHTGRRYPKGWRREVWRCRWLRWRATLGQSAIATVGAVAVLAGCGSDAKPVPSTRAATEYDYAEQTEAFLRSDALSQQAGMEFDKPWCETPFRAKPGETYTCTAVDREGATWTFTARITDAPGFVVTSGVSDDGRELKATPDTTG